MGLQIESGKGTPHVAEVDDHNRLSTLAITSTMEQHVNHQDGEAYTAMFSATPTGPGDCFGYIKNNSETDMLVSTAMLRCASDETIQFKLGDSGTPVGGNTITLVNRNAGSGKSADVTALQGVDITGLSGGGVAAGAFVKGGESSLQINISTALIIPKNKVISFYVATGTAAVMVGVEMHFHSH